MAASITNEQAEAAADDTLFGRVEFAPENLDRLAARLLNAGLFGPRVPGFLSS